MFGKRSCAIFLLLIAATTLVQPLPLFADNISKLNEAAAVLREIEAIPEQGMPEYLFRKAGGIAISPGLVKVGLLLGGRWGTGVMAVYRDGRWSNPVFISLSGLSFGLQFGGEATDVILVFKTQRSLDDFRNGRFSLGANVSLAAGPFGRHAEAATYLQMSGEIYSYSKSKGLFGGIAFENSAIAIDNETTAAFYGRDVTADEVFAGSVQAPPAAEQFARMLQNFTDLTPPN